MPKGMTKLKRMDEWFGRTNYGKRGAITTIRYKKKLDSHITELVAERNRERQVSIHAKQTEQNI